MLHFDSSNPIVTRDSRVSRAPPHHNLPAFLNLNGSKSATLWISKYKILSEIWMSEPHIGLNKWNQNSWR